MFHSSFAVQNLIVSIWPEILITERAESRQIIGGMSWLEIREQKNKRSAETTSAREKIVAKKDKVSKTQKTRNLRLENGWQLRFMNLLFF